MPFSAASAKFEENKENIPPSRTKNVKENGELPKLGLLETGSQTIPRHRRPLEQLDRNAVLSSKKLGSNVDDQKSTPSLHSGQEDRRQCMSAPISDKVEQENVSSKRSTKALESRDEGRQKKTKEPWRLQDSEVDAKQVVSILDLDPSENAGKTSDLFKKLEAEGKLSQKVLQFFAHCPFILTLNLTPGYAGKLNEIGLLTEPAFDPLRCTVPLYAGYRNLKALDMTNVLIGDDEIRYLIKLESLEALGLSGTEVTSKGLKYLSVHAKFSNSLLCLKLCYAQKIGDEAIPAIAGFKGLHELDLLGTDISVAGCLELVPNAQSSLQKLRLPSNVMQYLHEMNAYFSDKGLAELGQSNASNIGTHRLKEILRIFKRKYQDVFLSADAADIRMVLDNLLARRKKEELLWSIAKDSLL